ncbi:MAG: hypothetical protein ACHQM4_07505 [Thermoanaerobaculia bacterium]
MSRAAVGLRAHSGWAAAVTVGGDVTAPVLLDRRRLALADEAAPRPVQPYHASEGLPLARAERIVQRAMEEARRFGERDLNALAGDLLSLGHEVACCAVLSRSGRNLPALENVLASHALIHAAEGEMFREALRHAGRRAGLSVLDVKEKELSLEAVELFGIPEAKLQSRLGALGRAAGPPWAEDQKLAALAAWIALASGNKRGRPGHL